ncbi:uncharacterized protein [Miscanthus floridulus]|uniref:uncharacterized protein n=1 Tax=Miscanthus floridulus TaxID=154761 RepID=UPI00345987E6
MRAGQGKKHERFWLGDGVIDTASTPSLSQIRAWSTSESPAIRTRPIAAQHRVDALETRLEHEMRQRRELEARLQKMPAQLEAERAEREAERQVQAQRLTDITEFLQGLEQRVGFSLPAGLLVPPPSPRPTAPATPSPSDGGSNNPPHAAPNDEAGPSPQSQWQR